MDVPAAGIGEAPGRPPLTWCDVLEQEYRALHGEPPLQGAPSADPRQRLRDVYSRIHLQGPFALCLSGGGIRSATFALGVLQGLAHLGVLGRLHYLSTVSGGGYTGGWLTTWLHRAGREGRQAVLRDLDPAKGSLLTSDADTPDETSPIERVRRTCRYLAPTGGVVSADAWTLVTTMARNLLLNWLVLLPLVAAALLVPRVYYAVAQAVEQGFTAGPCLAAGTPQSWLLVATLAGFSVCTGYLVLNFVGRSGSWSQGRFLMLFLAPLVSAAVAFTLFWAAYPCQFSLRHALLISAAVPAGGWLLVGGLAPRIWGQPSPDDGSALHVRPGLRTILAALATGPVLGVGAYWFGAYEFGFGAGDHLRELYAVFGVPIVLGLVLLQMMVFIGFASSELEDGALEWWSRAGAWIAIVAALWVFGGVLVFYMADVIEAGLRAFSRMMAIDHQASSAVFAVLVPLVSSLAGLAARSGGQNGRPQAWRAAVQAIALPALIFVLLSAVAWANLRALERLEYHRVDGETLCTPELVRAGTPCHPAGAGLGEVLMLGGGLLGFGLLMSAFVPVNRFSLHGMYRQRLVRTFLGASRPDRRPNAFTGFDAHDDVRLHELRDVRPLHVVNATLNAVASTHVGRHQRQAQSFTFSPLHVGNQILGYRPAASYGSDGGGPATGLSFGMALAVSGAAASSALGIYSSKARAFLLTLANARLGLWFGNPQDPKTSRSSDPPLGVGPIVREMLGLTTDRNPYVYLSDGGHYENLGVWEMVARRCHRIVVSDAGCDPEYSFADLANAIRRIRLDLGIPIQFPPLELTRSGQGRTNPHVAIGTVRYSVIDGPDAPDGTIIYLKATLSGDEPVDVLNFATVDPAFPHDSTGDQFFDEARFESYRTLGFHTVLSAADAVLKGVAPRSFEEATACER
jgi:hypothetical protein